MTKTKFKPTFVNSSQISGFIEPTTTGTDKGKSFKRQSKGSKARENRKYAQLKSGTVILGGLF